MPTISAGLLLYRWHAAGEGGERRLQVLLVHPGGPYWAKKDLGAWSIPKGEAEPEELRGRAPAADGQAVAVRRAERSRPVCSTWRGARCAKRQGWSPRGPFGLWAA